MLGWNSVAQLLERPLRCGMGRYLYEVTPRDPREKSSPALITCHGIALVPQKRDSLPTRRKTVL
jgi:hypothetical protein